MVYTGWLVVFAKDRRYQPGLKLGGVLPLVGNNSSRGLVKEDILSSRVMPQCEAGATYSLLACSLRRNLRRALSAVII